MDLRKEGEMREIEAMRHLPAKGGEWSCQRLARETSCQIQFTIYFDIPSQTQFRPNTVTTTHNHNHISSAKGRFTKVLYYNVK